MIEITVDLGDRSYPIKIADNCLKTEQFSKYVNSTQVLIVTNETVAPIYLESFRLKLENEGLDADTLVLPDGEKYKSLETLNCIFDCLIDKRHNRTTTLIALGGGCLLYTSDAADE